MPRFPWLTFSLAVCVGLPALAVAAIAGLILFAAAAGQFDPPPSLIAVGVVLAILLGCAWVAVKSMQRLPRAWRVWRRAAAPAQVSRLPLKQDVRGELTPHP